jgi:YD repeat-containing protein
MAPRGGRNGNLLTETDPLGHTTAFTYDAVSNETSVTDGNGNTTSYSYDNANHVTQVTGADPDGGGALEAPIITYSYDDAGNRASVTGPRGNCSGCSPAAYTTTYTYDQNNRLASTTTPKGETTTSTSRPLSSQRCNDHTGTAATKFHFKGSVVSQPWPR